MSQQRDYHAPVLWWNRYAGFVGGPFLSRRLADEAQQALSQGDRPLQRIGEAVCTDFRCGGVHVPSSMGDCELCGHWDSALVEGACAQCRVRYGLAAPPRVAAADNNYGGQPLGEDQAPHLPDDYLEVTRDAKA